MTPTSLRLGALIAAGVLLVHEARFRLLVDGAETAPGGHDYIGVLAAVVGLGIALATGQYATALVGRRSEETLGPRRLPLWLVAATGVLAGYVGQELVAGALSPGHPVGLSGLVVHGGWSAVPLALAAGAVISLAIHSAAAVLARRCRSIARPARSAPQAIHPASRPLFRAGRLLARYLVGRAPPRPLSR